MTGNGSMKYWMSFVSMTLASGAIAASMSMGEGFSAQANPLQPEPGRTILSRRCTNCHSLELVRESSKSLAQWRETINAMVKYGATLTPPEHGVLAEYLARHFGIERKADER